MTPRTRLAVLGSPIAHSKSPALHAAAYSVLGLDWEYGAEDVVGAGLSRFVSSLDESWRGLSLTMPLKRDVLPLLDRVDPVVTLTGGANTVLLGDDGLSGFNTDVDGIVGALRESGVVRVGHAHLLGAGATAASTLVALDLLGATSVFVAARARSKADPLVELAERLGLSLEVGPLDEGFDAGRSRVEAAGGVRGGVTSAAAVTDLVVSTLPGGTRVETDFPAAVRRQTTLFDVAYDPWPSALAEQWQHPDAGGRVVSGIRMLVLQALAQVRVFVLGDPGSVLPDEERVLEAMRASVGLPSGLPSGPASAPAMG